MNNEAFNPERFRSASVDSVFANVPEGAHPFSARMQDRFRAIEQAHLSPEGEPALLFQMSQMAAEGASLRSIAGKFGLTYKLVGGLLQAADIPYATRAEAVQRLWQDEEFRQRNGAAVEKGFEQFLGDDERKAQKAEKLRAANIARFEDPEERRLASERTRRQFEDPDQRKKLSDRQTELMTDPERREALARKSQEYWSRPESRRQASERQAQRMTDPERRRALAEQAREQWTDPAYRDQQSERAKRQWQDPDFVALHSEKMKKQWEDAEFVETRQGSSSRSLSQLWQDPEYRAAAIERSRQSMIRLRQNPEYLERGAEASRQTRRFAEYGAQRREIALSIWQDPDYRTRLSRIHTELWQDPEYRQMIMQALRTARLDPANRDRYYLPTIQGFRPDIGFHAQSTWEANVARVFQLTGRQYEVGIILPLVVTDPFRNIFDSPEVAFSVDFATTDRRGNSALYEIMAHPLEDPDGWAKLLMAQEQFPNLNLRAIDEPYYQTLKSRYEARINADPNLLGWEKDGFNLRTHPEVFNPEVQ